MADVKNTIEVLKEMAMTIKHGEWNINLIIYDGEIVGFDQVESPKVRFRQERNKKV